MNRRMFISGLLAAMVAERAIEPARKYVFAPVGGWNSEVILNPWDVITSLQEFRVMLQYEYGGIMGTGISATHNPPVVVSP